MKAILVFILLVNPVIGFSVEYSNCQYGSLRGRIDSYGKIIPRSGEVIKLSKNSNGQEVIVFEWVDPRFKGTKNDTLIINRDSVGNIIGYEDTIDLSGLSRSEMMIIRDSEAEKQAFSDNLDCSYDSFQAAYVTNQITNSDTGSFLDQARKSCASVAISDANGNYAPANFLSFNKSDFDQFKNIFGDLSWQEFESIKKLSVGTIEQRRELKKIISSWLDKGGFSTFNGEKVSFNISNGICSLDSVSKSMVSSKGNIQSYLTEYDSKNCDQIYRILKDNNKDIVSLQNLNKKILNSQIGEIGFGAQIDTTLKKLFDFKAVCDSYQWAQGSSSGNKPLSGQSANKQ